MAILPGQSPGKNTSSDSNINIPQISGDQFVPGTFSNYPAIKDTSLYDYGIKQGPPGPQPTPAKHDTKDDSIGYQKGKIPKQMLNQQLIKTGNKSGSINTAPQGFENLKKKIMGVPNTYNQKGMSQLNGQTIQTLISSIAQFLPKGSTTTQPPPAQTSTSNNHANNTANTANTANLSSNNVMFLPGQIGV